MLANDGRSVGLDTNRLPLAARAVAGLYPGVSDGGMDVFSCSVSWDGMMVGLLVFPTLTSRLDRCFDALGVRKESFRWGRLCSCVLARDDCEVGESVGPGSWCFGSWATRGDPLSGLFARGDDEDSLVSSVTGSSCTCVMADVGAELDLDEREVSRDGERSSDLELRVDPDFLLFGASWSLNLSLRPSPFGRGRNSLGGSRGLSWASEPIEPCVRP